MQYTLEIHRLEEIGFLFVCIFDLILYVITLRFIDIFMFQIKNLEKW